MIKIIDPRCIGTDGTVIMVRGLSCPFCGASVEVWHDGTSEHHPEYDCKSWAGDHEVQDFIVNLAYRLMKGSPGWPT